MDLLGPGGRTGLKGNVCVDVRDIRARYMQIAFLIEILGTATPTPRHTNASIYDRRESVWTDPTLTPARPTTPSNGRRPQTQ